MAVENVLNQAINAFDQSIGVGLSTFNNFLGQFVQVPIGLWAKSYPYLQGHLNRNIGAWQASFEEKMYTPIGYRGDTGFERQTYPWFLLDKTKNDYYDYVNYIDNVYFNGSKRLINVNPNGIMQVNYESLVDENTNKVGSVNQITQWDYPETFAINTSSSYINPHFANNMGLDTRLGTLSNYYMVNALNASESKGQEMGFSAYQNPKDNTNNAENESQNNEKSSGSSITKGIYSLFGVKGFYGLSEGHSILDNDEFEGMAVPNSYLTSDVIPWSTADNLYDVDKINDDLQRVANILGGSADDYSMNFIDEAQNTTTSRIYAPFGNYYSVTYSLGLLANSGARTQKFIANSMLGIPLSQAREENIELISGENFRPTYRGQKYYVGTGTRGTNYLDRMTGSVVDFVKYNGTENRHIVRLDIKDAGNDNLWSANHIFEYMEAEGKTVLTSPRITSKNFNEGIVYGKHVQYDLATVQSRPDIINKTNELFRTNKIKSIVARFHTDEFLNKTAARADKEYTSTAVSKYGMSRGRNLLKRKHKNSKTHQYTNPYCRVWTYHNQYSQIKNLIRPFNPSLFAESEITRFRTQNKDGWSDGQKRLMDLGSKSSANGLIMIAPTKNGDVQNQLKRLMFSIENLAWKDSTDNLDEDQKGPLGGRIMWFPPYNLEFNENVVTQWNEVEFIGRGEKIPTYINTSRSGVLSFDILIDHPSIINSFNNGQIGGEGIGDVDDTESNEQAILRFFAGCELLGKSSKTKKNQEKQKKEIEPYAITTISAEYEEIFSFFVFFPNNYSGVDDLTNNSSNSSMDSFYPFLYLIRGQGAGYLEDEEKQLLNEGLSLFNASGPGYEMRPYKISRGGNTIDTQGLSMGCKTPEDFDNLFGNRKSYKSSQGKLWAYRVDKKYENEKLEPYNYVDNKTYSLNTNIGLGEAKLAYNIGSDKNCFSFIDTFCALADCKDSLIVTNEDNDNDNLFGDGDYSDSKNLPDDSFIQIEDIISIDKINDLQEILQELKDGHDTLKVTVSGYASQHGYSQNNSQLSSNRKKTVETWMRKHPLFKNAIFEEGTSMTASFKLGKSVNEMNAKLGRAAYVVVYKPKESLVDNIGIDNINGKDNQIERTLRGAQDAYNTMANFAIQGSNASSFDELKEVNRNILTSSIFDVDESGGISLRLTTNVEDYQRTYDQAQADKGAIGKANGTPNENTSSLGYKNEYTFFSSLESNDSFLHSKLVEKFKYFDPAFHSITPEGYQARLTFLHQCTRQGGTRSWTDGTSLATAANLAFGRPPILVLRIGDFYNTKITVSTLSIDFKNGQGIQWDLNDEGIGVMPMYAHVSMNINFYGGSDLGGPVSRLQNAVSFNYYANTSVYDDRSEMVKYENGKLTDMCVWTGAVLEPTTSEGQNSEETTDVNSEEESENDAELTD